MIDLRLRLIKMLGLTWIFLISLADVKIDAKRSVSYDFPGPYCGYQPRELDGIILRSSHNLMYANSGCVMRFESDDDFFTSKKLMMNFRYFNITDCSVSLKVFYRSDAFGQPDLALDCRSSRPAVLYSAGKYLTLRLDKTTNVGYDFEIIITSFKYGPFCKEFHCRNDKCIDRDLMCDGVDNCFDNSDELACYGHLHRGEGVYRGRSKMWLILSSSLVLMAIIVAMCFAGVCVFRRRRYRATLQTQTIRLQQPPQRHHQQQQQHQQQQPLFENTQPTMPQPPAYSNVVPPYPSVPDAQYPTNAPYPASGYSPYPTQPPGYPPQPSTYPSQPYTGYQGFSQQA